ncbi:carbohydrate kinase family protein [Aliifodinibius sp. S!AR15-10]|nr:carbohydrate kinase family protein [Aliifodinibius sp. S!AR15-10]
MSNRKWDLLVVGELNMDLILDEVESFPELEKEKIAGDMNLTLGSSSAIFASNIARLGARTGFCGLVGDDDFGTQIINQLQDFGIETLFVKQDPQQKTGLTAIIRLGNERAMITFPGAMASFSASDIPERVCREARHLHISSIFLQPGIRQDLQKIVNRAKSNGMTVSIDPQWDPKEQWNIDLDKLLHHIDFFLPNEAEFLQLAATETVEQGLKKFYKETSATIVVKCGTEGAAFIEDNKVQTIPAFINNDPVDAIGAGDSFNAGFIFRFLQGYPLEECVTFGNLTGSISTTQAGGTAAITSLGEVLRIAKDKYSITDIDEITR